MHDKYKKCRFFMHFKMPKKNTCEGAFKKIHLSEPSVNCPLESDTCLADGQNICLYKLSCFSLMKFQKQISYCFRKCVRESVISSTPQVKNNTFYTAQNVNCKKKLNFFCYTIIVIYYYVDIRINIYYTQIHLLTLLINRLYFNPDASQCVPQSCRSLNTNLSSAVLYLEACDVQKDK